MNVVVAQSGGPTAAINASLLGVYRRAREWSEVETVYGSVNGIEGVLRDRLISLNDRLATPEDERLLRQTPAAALGSCRYKLPSFAQDAVPYEQIRDTLRRHDIGAFFYIGGNDSMDTVDKLSAYFAETGDPIRVIGVPKTIDNDLMCSDHTPGYGSAAKFVATAMAEMIRDCTVYDLENVLIVEVMGRDTGWLTAAAALPRLNGETAPQLLYLPEAPFSAEGFLRDVRSQLRENTTVVVAVSEGVRLDTLAAYQSGKVDNFGHQYLSGVGKCLEDLVRREIGCKVRSVELNILQRCASHAASLTDLEEAEQAGREAVADAAAGNTGDMIAMRRVSDAPYAVAFDRIPVHEVANRVKYVPREWINAAGNDVLPAALAYIRPLIQGEAEVITENGLPRHCRLY